MDVPGTEARTPIGLAVSRSGRGGKRVVVGSSGVDDGSPFETRTPRPVSVSVVRVNDDEAERRLRRLNSNFCTMLSPGCHTPRSAHSSSRYLVHGCIT